MNRPDNYNKRYRHVGINLTREAMARGSISLDARKIVMENKGNKYSVRMRRDVDVEMDYESDDDLPGKKRKKKAKS